MTLFRLMMPKGKTYPKEIVVNRTKDLKLVAKDKRGAVALEILRV